MKRGITREAATRTMDFDETIQRLSQSPSVEGIAEFGSRASDRDNASSDYDLLIVLRDLPAPIFQMITTIDGHIADIVPVQVEVIEGFVADAGKMIASRFNLMLTQKLRSARILFDRSGLMGSVQAAAQAIPEQRLLPQPAPFAKRYAEMFWQGFVIQQAQRMARSNDETHRLAADMMLSSILTQTYRSYFELRGLTWEGEKAALRCWQRADPDCYALVRSMINASDLEARLIAYEALSTHVLAGYGAPIRAGQTAMVFASEINEADAEAMLDYWDGLFSQRSKHQLL